MRVVLWQALLYGGAAGVLGTGLGGLAGYLLIRPGDRLIASLMNFSGGLMVAVVCFDLLPEGYSLSGAAPTLIGVGIGVLLMACVQRFMNSSSREGISRMGVLISIGIALHNLPEGLAIGAGFSRTPALGFSLCVAIALHDVPEGLSMAVPLRAGGTSPFRILMYTLAAGLPTAIGALIGYAVGSVDSMMPFREISAIMVSMCMGVASGAMLYVTGELLPSAFELHRGRLPAFLWVIGLIMGSVTSLLI